MHSHHFYDWQGCLHDFRHEVNYLTPAVQYHLEAAFIRNGFIIITTKDGTRVVYEKADSKWGRAEIC